jgi:tetratricopeptide (TPR) repeat protein
MKKIAMVTCCALGISLAAPLLAQDSTVVVETNSHSIFKGIFQSVWAHLRTLNPVQEESASAKVEYNAGIRGAETTETLLKPYWKGDLTQNQSFQSELEKFRLAQVQMDQGNLKEAVRYFDEFLQEFGDSALRPNALFGKSISLAGIGETSQSLAIMQQFIVENPAHPLVGDARKVVQNLSLS